MIDQIRHLGRAKNAILSFLEQRLSIPKIYIDAYWAEQRIDVLAINRDGVGDVHAVLIFPNHISGLPNMDVEYLTDGINPIISRLTSIPAQYKYIAAVDVTSQGADPLPGIPHPVMERTFSPDGIGRIGFLSISFPLGEEPQTRSVLKPERFRARIAQLADDYIQKHEADWEIRA